MKSGQYIIVVLALLSFFPLYADTLIVDIGAGGDFTSIQEAVNSASDYDQIEVAPGTYYEAVDFLGKAVRLYSSDGPEVTIIDGTGHYHVVQCISGEGPDTTLEGFTITGGNADDGRRGGGMYNYLSSPTVINCTFIQNSASYRGGGGMANEEGSPIVTGCTFTENYAVEPGGGMLNYYSSPVVTDCIFSGNSAHDLGGGMYNGHSSPTVTNCTFSDNTTQYLGGGMYNRYSSPTVTNCSFTRNYAYTAGGGMTNLYYSGPIVTNCTFSGNMSPFHGGGMHSAENSNPVVTNCTFTGNFYEGLYNYNTSPTVTNCIFWDNYPKQIYNVDTASPIITYSNIEGGYAGTGNIDADPMFVDLEDDNLRLSCGSPCIDTADSSVLLSSPFFAFDLDGNMRFVDIIAVADSGIGTWEFLDMGAYEFQCVSSDGDVNCDCLVNLLDLAILAENWLQ